MAPQGQAEQSLPRPFSDRGVHFVNADDPLGRTMPRSRLISSIAASTTHCPSATLTNSTRSPGQTLRSVRTLAGIMICPLLVTVAVAIAPFLIYEIRMTSKVRKRKELTSTIFRSNRTFNTNPPPPSECHRPYDRLLPRFYDRINTTMACGRIWQRRNTGVLRSRCAKTLHHYTSIPTGPTPFTTS